jgi:hypothetical protein
VKVSVDVLVLSNIWSEFFDNALRRGRRTADSRLLSQKSQINKKDSKLDSRFNIPGIFPSDQCYDRFPSERAGVPKLYLCRISTVSRRMQSIVPVNLTQDFTFVSLWFKTETPSHSDAGSDACLMYLLSRD